MSKLIYRKHPISESQNHYYLIFTSLVALCFWFLETCIHYFLFGEVGFVVVPSDTNELWMRIAIVILLVSFGFYADRTSKKIVDANITAFHLKIISRAKKQWEAVADTLPQLIIALDHNARVTRVNRTLEVWGLGRINDIAGLRLSDLFNEIHADYGNAARWPDLWQQVQSSDLVERKIEHKKAGKTFHYTMKRIADYESSKDQCYAVLVIDDITEQQNAEKALRTYALELEKTVNERTLELRLSNERLKEKLQILSMAQERLAKEKYYNIHLLHKLFVAQENERKRIAIELHDSIGQSLGATKFRLEELLLSHQGDMDENVNNQLDDLVAAIRLTMDEVRNISMNLRPPMLDDLGVLPTLKWFCREFENTYKNITVKLLLDNVNETDIDITDNIEVTIFRIVQEATHNIAKYANATNIVVELSNTDTELKLSIQDNGCGFDVNSLVNEAGNDQCVNSSLGLGSMRERADSTSGEFSIESYPDQGTTVIVSWHKRGMLSQDAHSESHQLSRVDI